MRWKAAAASVALGVGVWLSSIAAAQDYEIRLHRPEKPGLKYRELVVGHDSQKMALLMGDKAVQQKAGQFSVEFESEVTVLEVGENGKPTKESHAVAKCVQVEGEARKPLIEPGTVVVASAGESAPAFEVNGQPVAPAVAQALSLVISLNKGPETDDDILGTRERKKVGESWPVNAEAIARGLNRTRVGVRPEDVAGNVTLVGVVRVGEIECLDIRAVVALKNVTLPVPLPPDLKIAKSDGRVTLTGKFPTDASIGRTEGSLELVFEFRATGKPDPNAGEVALEMAIQKQALRRRAFAK